VLGRLLGGSDTDARARAEAVYIRFRALLLERLTAGPLSLPGVSAALARLKAAEIRLAVTTGSTARSPSRCAWR